MPAYGERWIRSVEVTAGSSADGPIPHSVFEYVRTAVRSYEVTPLAAVAVTVAGRSRILLLRLEGHPHWRSMKARTVLGLILSARNALTGSPPTIVEYTSGNPAAALPVICRDLRFKFVAVVDPLLPATTRERMLCPGTHLEKVEATAPKGAHLLLRIERVRQLLSRIRDSAWTNQYENRANKQVHALRTAPELDGHADPRLDAMFASVSTGGSFAGLVDHFAASRPSTRIIAVDIGGSMKFGGALRLSLLNGIGAARPSTFFAPGTPPEHVTMSDAKGITVCRVLAAQTGMKVGGSSRGAITGSLRYMAEHPDVSVAACLCPDISEAYQSTMYDDWLTLNSGLEPSATLRLDISGDTIRFALMGTCTADAQPEPQP